MSMPDPAAPLPPPQPSPVRRFFGGLLFCVGALMVLLSGTCTISLAVEEPSWAGMAIIVGLFGLVPGAGLCFLGRMLWRR
jgi:hypothetical protein